MAEERELSLDADAEGESGGGGGKSKLIVIILILLIVIGGAAGAFVLLGGEDSAEQSEEPVEEPVQPAKYLTLRPAFIQNYQVDNRKHYLQVEITLMSRDDKHIETLEQHLPVIKNTIVGWLGQQSFYELRDPESRESLRFLLLDFLRMKVEEETGDPMVEDILFTGFVMQ